MPTPCWLKHLCSIRVLVPLSFSLSLSLSLSLFQANFWSAEAFWVHFPARGCKTLLRRHSAPSPPREGTWGLREQSKSCVRDFIGFLSKPRNINLFLSPLLSYHQLQTTRFQSIKGPQHSLNIDLSPTHCEALGKSLPYPMNAFPGPFALCSHPYSPPACLIHLCATSTWHSPQTHQLLIVYWSYCCCWVPHPCQL